MKVFIGGSRAVSKLNVAMRARIDEVVIDRGHTAIIGDANGADKAVQQYLAERHYPHVIVFCMEKCRNNVGGWPIHNVDPPVGSTGFAYYSAKDLVMSQEAKCGLMLWDGKSKGPLQNLLRLTSAEKRSLVYFAPTKDFQIVGNESDLRALLALCRKCDVDMASRGLGLKTSLTEAQLPLASA
jgi:hypothetical protein